MRINTPRAQMISQHAYINKTVRGRNRVGAVAGLGRTVHESTTLFADFVRHAVTMIGILGLVGLAVGATTECKLYHDIINWIGSFFVS